MADSGNTVIGTSILVSGHLQGDEDLTILGKIEGSVNLTKTLIVEESGIVKADVSVRSAIISGVVVGNIVATDSVELTEAGRVVGDIKAPRVIIVDGARFRGNVDMGDLEAPRASQPLPARSERPASKSTLLKPAAKVSQPIGSKKAPPPPPPARKEEPKKSEPPKVPVMVGKKIKKKVVVKKKS